MNVKIFFTIFLIFSFSSCSLSTSADYQSDACVQIKKLTKDLKAVKDPIELQKKAKVIKKDFNKLTSLIISYRTYLEKNGEDEIAIDGSLEKASKELKVQLERIYNLDGGREVIEKAQKEAYIKLSLFENHILDDTIDLYKAKEPLN